MTVPELLRREMVRLARRPTVADWLERTRRRPAWELRGQVRSSDPRYVALAEALDATLVTVDQRLAAAPDCAARGA